MNTGYKVEYRPVESKTMYIVIEMEHKYPINSKKFRCRETNKNKYQQTFEIVIAFKYLSPVLTELNKNYFEEMNY